MSPDMQHGVFSSSQQKDLHHSRSPYHNLMAHNFSTPAISQDWPQDSLLRHQSFPGPSFEINNALDRLCGLRIRHYFVAVAADEGIFSAFVSGGRRLPENVIRQFFDAGQFQEVMNRLEAGTDPKVSDSLCQEDQLFRRNIFSHNRNAQRRSSLFDGDCGQVRPPSPLIEGDDTRVTASSTRVIEVSDTDALWGFYEQRFKNCQQDACKLIAKAWIKTVEPKKQSIHPYTGSDEMAPNWWPKPWGPTENDRVRHKEPDHLYKRERVHLLVHILQLITEPNATQHPDVRKLNLNVAKLEENTTKALSSFFMNNDANGHKINYLADVFRVARQEERYRNGEISGSTGIYVIAEDKLPGSYISDKDDTTDFSKSNEDKPIANESKTMLGAMRLTPSVGTQATTPAGSLVEPFVGQLAMGNSQFLPPTMNGMTPQHSLVDSGALQVPSQGAIAAIGPNMTLNPVRNPYDASRRPSVFSDLSSSPFSEIYPEQWQASLNGATDFSMYTYVADPEFHLE